MGTKKFLEKTKRPLPFNGRSYPNEVDKEKKMYAIYSYCLILTELCGHKGYLYLYLHEKSKKQD